jgi:hypothetical protein
MNWQSDFVSPQHHHYIQQQQQQQQQHQQRVTPKRLQASNSPDTTYLPQRLSNLVQLSLSNSSSSSAMSQQNSNHLYTNSSNYNRILASAGGGSSSGVSSSPSASTHHNSMSQQQQHAQSQHLVPNNYSQTQNNSMFTSNSSSHLAQPQSSSASNNNNNTSKNYTLENPISNFNSNFTNSVTSSTTKNLVAQTIELIKHLNIKLIAFDFDCTIVNIHTGGQWIDSPEKLAEFVRPCFRSLLPALLQTPDLYVCVVTYSPQEQLIKEVLKISMKDEQSVNDLVSKIVIKGNTKEFLEQHGIEYCYSNGKQIHLKYCRNYFESANNNNNKKSNKENLRINDSNILLIDDDVQNLKVAYDNGHLVYQVNNNMKLMDFYNYLREKLSILI